MPRDMLARCAPCGTNVALSLNDTARRERDEPESSFSHSEYSREHSLTVAWTAIADASHSASYVAARGASA